MSKKITRMTAVAAALAATAIAAPSADAKPIDSTLPAGINAGLGPSSGLATIAAPSADAKRIDSSVPAGTNAGLGLSSGEVAIARASADSPPVAAPNAPTGGFDWGDASIAGAGMLTLLGLGAGSVILVRRSGRAGQTVG